MKVARQAAWTLACIALLILLFGLLRIPEATFTYKAGAALLALLALAAPWPIFLTCVALIPMASMFGPLTQSTVHPYGNSDMLMMTALLAWCRFRITSPVPPRETWRAWALLLASASLGSAIVQLALDSARWVGPGYWSSVVTMVAGTYFSGPGELSALYAAAALTAGAWLMAGAVDFARARPERVAVLARMLVISAAGAAALNVWRLLSSAIASGDAIERLMFLLKEARIDSQFASVNAAGPYFAMLLPVAGALWVIDPARRAAWGASVALMAAGLWLTGSRSALAAAIVAGVVALVVSVPTRKTRIAVVVAALIAAATLSVVARDRLRADTLKAGATERVAYATTSLSMFATRPLLGVGVGRYFTLSNQFAPPELIETWAQADPHENAHNNYLQILAELGLAGLVMFLGLVGSVLWRLYEGASDVRLRRGIAAGLAAFLLAAAATHPLLVRPMAYLFFVVLGVAVAASGAAVPRRRWQAAALVAALLVIAMSIPVRADRERRETNLENVTVGTSRWQPALDGVRYVVAGREARLFVDSSQRGAIVPLRLPPSTASTRRVSIYLDGRLANVVIPRRDEWLNVVIALPESRQRFRPVDLSVEGPVEGGKPDELLFVGKLRPVGQR